MTKLLLIALLAIFALSCASTTIPFPGGSVSVGIEGDLAAGSDLTATLHLDLTGLICNVVPYASLLVDCPEEVEEGEKV